MSLHNLAASCSAFKWLHSPLAFSWRLHNLSSWLNPLHVPLLVHNPVLNQLHRHSTSLSVHTPLPLIHHQNLLHTTRSCHPPTWRTLLSSNRKATNVPSFTLVNSPLRFLVNLTLLAITLSPIKISQMTNRQSRSWLPLRVAVVAAATGFPD